MSFLRRLLGRSNKDAVVQSDAELDAALAADDDEYERETAAIEAREDAEAEAEQARVDLESDLVDDCQSDDDSRTVNARLRLAFVSLSGEDFDGVYRVTDYSRQCAGGSVVLRGADPYGEMCVAVSRVRSAQDEAGRPITDLLAHLDRLWESSPERVEEKLYERFGLLLKSLAWLAASDGRIGQREKAVVSRVVCRVVRGCTPQMVERHLLQSRLKSLDGWKKLIPKVLAEGAVTAEVLLALCRAVAEADGSIHSREAEALKWLESRCGAQTAR